MRFQDQVAVITAAGSGIGRATADIIGREGGIVIAVDNHAERLDTTVNAILRAGGRAHPVQQAWAAEQVSQCGFCDPGFIVAIAALLAKNPQPSPDQIDALPNMCACGAQPRILRAIQRASQAVAGSTAPVAPAADPAGPTVSVPEQPLSIGSSGERDTPG